MPTRKRPTQRTSGRRYWVDHDNAPLNFCNFYLSRRGRDVEDEGDFAFIACIAQVYRVTGLRITADTDSVVFSAVATRRTRKREG